jgi:hypothetical protein
MDPAMALEQRTERRHRNFDPSFYGTAIRIGAVICALIFVGEIAVFLMIDSSATRCPGLIVSGSRSSQPVHLWILVLFAGLWTLNIAYHAVTWRRFASNLETKIDIAERTWVSSEQFNFWQRSWTDLKHVWKEFNAFLARRVNFNSLIVIVLVASVAFVAVPLIALAAACT